MKASEIVIGVLIAATAVGILVRSLSRRLLARRLHARDDEPILWI